MPLFVGLLLFVVPAIALSATVNIGGVSICIPPPNPDFVEVNPRMTLLWRFMQLNEGGFVILAMYIPKSAEKAALSGEFPELDRNITITTMRKAENELLTAEFFGQTEKEMKKKIASHAIGPLEATEIEHVNGNLAKLAGREPQLTLNRVLILPIYSISENSFSLSQISITQFNSPNGNPHQDESIETSTTLLVKGKILFINVGGSKNDLLWTQKMTKTWVESINRSNQSAQ